MPAVATGSDAAGRCLTPPFSFLGCRRLDASGTLVRSKSLDIVRIAFFYLLLTGLLALTFWRGRSDERLAAGVCIGGTFLTVLVGNNLSTNASGFGIAAFLVDFAVLTAFIAIALRSSRFWPIWVAGLQLTTTSVHLLIVLAPKLPGGIFGYALAFWSYPILLLIAVGAWRTPIIERWRDEYEIASRRMMT